MPTSPEKIKNHDAFIWQVADILRSNYQPAPIPMGHCDWTQLPAAASAEGHVVCGNLGINDTVSLEEAHVYASIEQARDAKLKAWLGVDAATVTDLLSLAWQKRVRFGGAGDE